MYSEIEGGTYEIIAGLKCWIPPPPPDEEIAYHDLPKEEQYWRRTPLPEWWHPAYREEQIRKELDPSYIDPKLQLFRNQEWLRRMNGFWFFNNGVRTYLTGTCYFYMNWWRGDHPVNDGYPLYYNEIRRRFYFRQYCVEDPLCLGYVISGSRGFGKELADYEPVKTFTGETKIGEITKGTKVYGRDGKLTTVTGVYPQGEKDIYRITLGDGRQVDAGLEHQWGVYVANKVYKTVTTEQMLNNFRLKHKRSGYTYKYFLPINEPVEYEERELPIDPYIMGYMIGNGICKHQTPAVCTIDKFVLDYFKSVLKDYRFNPDTTSPIKYSISYQGSDKNTNPERRLGSNPLHRALKELGANVNCKDKFIPEIYKFSSIEQRYEVVRGLLDSDGSCNKDGSVEFCSANENLVKDLANVVRSLGIRCQIGEEHREGQAHILPQGTHTTRGKMYRLFIRTDKPVFKLPRKLERLKPRTKANTVSIVNIEYIGKHSATCISVDNEEKLYLTRDFIVTHNTAEETCAVVESLTKTPRKRKGVIQSKSEDDAKKKVFQEKIVPSYNDLPEFFKPVSNHGTHPEKGLSFFRDSVRGKGKKNVTFNDNDELQNILYPVPAKEKYLSGGSYAEIFNDEIGITDPKKEADVEIRMQVNRFCVYRNSRKIGLMRCTTTVEEIDKGGAEFKKVWDKSDQNVRTDNGFTISGCYRYFVSDIDATTQFADKYGVIDKVKAMLFHDNERKSREKDRNEWMSYVRKNPRNEREMFMVRSDKCHFDAYALTSQLESIQNMDIMPYRCGMFEWENGVRNTKIEWKQCTHPEKEYEEDRDTGTKYCKHCRYVVTNLPDPKGCNLVTAQNFGAFMAYTPQNAIKFTAGLDPFQNSLKDLQDESRGSKAGFYIKMKYDPLIDTSEIPPYQHKTDAPCLEYLYRPLDVFDMYEDILKAIWYFGCPIFPETNKPGFKNWLRENGYENFLVIKPKGITSNDDLLKQTSDGGASSTTPMIQHYTDLIQSDVKRNCYKYFFPRLLYQLLHFDNSETQKFDAAVGWGFTLVGGMKKVEEKKTTVNVQLFRTYDAYGNEIIRNVQ